MRKTVSGRQRVWLGGAIAAVLAFAACDQTELRSERAKELADAAIEQLSGGESGNGGAMERVSQDERALAGDIESPVAFETAAAPSRFAVGSIIAKPKDVPEPEPVLEMEAEVDQPEEAIALEADVVSPASAGKLPTLSLDPQKRETEEQVQAHTAPIIERIERARQAPRSRSLGRVELGEDGRLEPPPPPGAPEVIADGPPLPPAQIRKLARRTMPSARSIRAQTDARTKMLDAMEKYGLSGSVELSPTGQMKIQLGSDGGDPTQFTTEQEEPDGDIRDQRPPNPRSILAVSLPEFAFNSTDTCPEDVSDEAVRRNPVLATACVVQSLRQTGDFEYVEKDFLFDHQFARRPPPGETAGETTGTGVATVLRPDDPLYDLQWHFRSNGDGVGESLGGAGFADFWNRKATTGSDDVVVAVVDTGLQLDHPDIENSPNVYPGWDMVSDPRMGNDGDGRDDSPDDPGDLCDPNVPGAEDSYHGTHVAGTIGAAATNNGSGVAAGAWQVKIVPVRALGKCGGRLSDINDAIRWAGGLIPAYDDADNEIWNDNPADIINLSIGLFEFCPASLQEAINDVVERGAVVVSAAGNARTSTRFYAPGGCENVVSVAAGDARGQIAPYSNFGAEVDVLAPGGDLTRDDDEDGRPDGVLSTKLSSDCYDPLTNAKVDGCYYAYEQGTSMAAPHVSAAFALLKADNPDLAGTALVDTLLGSLDPRTAEQCSGLCTAYPGTDEIPGSDGLCSRPCGGGLLNLANIGEAD